MQLIHSGFFAVNLQMFFCGGQYKNGICKGPRFRLKKKLEIPGGWGVSKNPLEFQGVGEGAKVKNLPLAGADIFWNHTLPTWCVT